MIKEVNIIYVEEKDSTIVLYTELPSGRDEVEIEYDRYGLQGSVLNYLEKLGCDVIGISYGSNMQLKVVVDSIRSLSEYKN